MSITSKCNKGLQAILLFCSIGASGCNFTQIKQDDAVISLADHSTSLSKSSSHRLHPPMPHPVNSLSRLSPASTTTHISPRIRNENGIVDLRSTAGFKALDFPKMSRAAAAERFLDGSDFVLGMTIRGKSRAYPVRFTWRPHVINDKIIDSKGNPIYFAVTYCALCNTAICYDTTTTRLPIKLDFFGLYDGVFAFCDRTTHSIWQQGATKAVSGRLTGKRLSQLSILEVPWYRWRRMHPDTLVMSPPAING